MLYVSGMFPLFFHFTWIKLNDCDDVIILPLMNLMYMSLWYLYMYVTPCPMVMWLFQPYIQIFKCCFISGPVKSVLRDPSLEENTSFFLKWFCCYLGVYLLQPGYILSANSLYLAVKKFHKHSRSSFREIVLFAWKFEENL